MTITSDGSDMVGCSQNPCEYIADVLGLELPKHVDPVRAIELDIRRLLQTEQRWSEACAIARVHCPVGDGESHVRQGIPALAARCHKAEERILLLEAQLAERNALCFDHRGDFEVRCRECEEHRAAYKRMRELEGTEPETPHNETAGFMAAVRHDIALAKHDAPVCGMTERPGHIDGCIAHHSGPCWTKARTP